LGRSATKKKKIRTGIHRVIFCFFKNSPCRKAFEIKMVGVPRHSAQFRIVLLCQYQWPRILRRRTAAACLLGVWVSIPPEGMDVFCECCALSGRGLCNELITRPEESYRLWCVFCVCSRNLKTEEAMASVGRSATKRKINFLVR
jgi:hypothetical protein